LRLGESGDVAMWASIGIRAGFVNAKAPCAF
jgi:hypothetical protein